jgi:TP901 family phage tail tape measure protein
LQLGETLEDGTSLNKYSQALKTVGIEIVDVSGNIKDMDTILDELGSRWKTLAEDQKLALAQTVAGTRQYNNLIALLDEWDSGDADSMVSNLATAADAMGELNNQAEIYSESWEAAKNRVRAAAQELYGKVLDDDFFIGLLDALSATIDGVGSLVDAFGGLKGILFTIGSYATRLF